MSVTGRLLTIGRFAQLTGLTVRALRLYDEWGLRAPAAVDGSSGYRYYTNEQFAHADLIRRLRGLDLSLEEIGRFLAGDQQSQQEILDSHRQRLRDRIAGAGQSLRTTDELIKEITMPTSPAPIDATPMERKTVPDQPVMRIRWTLPEEPTEEYPLGPLYSKISEVIDRQGLTAVGAPYCIGYSESTGDGLVHGEAGIPVATTGVAEGEVEPAVLPGGEVASARYTGPSGASGDGIGRTRDLWSQIDAAGLVAHGDPRWVYLSKPEAPAEEHISELVWPLS